MWPGAVNTQPLPHPIPRFPPHHSPRSQHFWTSVSHIGTARNPGRASSRGAICLLWLLQNHTGLGCSVRRCARKRGESLVRRFSFSAATARSFPATNFLTFWPFWFESFQICSCVYQNHYMIYISHAVWQGDLLAGRCVEGVTYLPFFHVGESSGFRYNNRTPETLKFRCRYPAATCLYWVTSGRSVNQKLLDTWLTRKRSDSSSQNSKYPSVFNHVVKIPECCPELQNCKLDAWFHRAVSDYSGQNPLCLSFRNSPSSLSLSERKAFLCHLHQFLFWWWTNLKDEELE